MQVGGVIAVISSSAVVYRIKAKSDRARPDHFPSCCLFSQQLRRKMANGSNAAWPGWAACVLCGGVGHLDVDCKYGVKGADGPVARQPVFCEGANVDARDDSQCPPDEASRESEAQAGVKIHTCIAPCSCP